jgi:hypothetical protein
VKESGRLRAWGSYHGGECGSVGSCCRRCRLQAATVSCFHGSSFWEKKEGSLPLPSQCGLLAFMTHQCIIISFTSPLIPKNTRWFVINYNSILLQYLHLLRPALFSLLSSLSPVLPKFQFFPSSCLFPPEALMCYATTLDASSSKRCHCPSFNSSSSPIT